MTASSWTKWRRGSWRAATRGNSGTNRRSLSCAASSRDRRRACRHPEEYIMAVEKSYARLGLFLVITLVVVLATALLFIQRLRSHSVIAMVTYTTGNVSGLDISSPVRFRGVHIGQVTDVRVDPRGNLVEIDFEVFLDRLNTLGMDVKRIQKITDIGGMIPRLRAQVVGNPVTGEAYLLLDSPQNPPPAMTLGFTPTKPYVPSMPSVFSAVQD